jgi:hypothetical protein
VVARALLVVHRAVLEQAEAAVVRVAAVAVVAALLHRIPLQSSVAPTANPT